MSRLFRPVTTLELKDLPYFKSIHDQGTINQVLKFTRLQNILVYRRVQADKVAKSLHFILKSCPILKVQL